MSLALSRRRRRWALGILLAAAGGYATYKLYTSDAGRRKRQQFARLFSVLFVLSDAAQQSAESVVLLSADIKSFLLSDEDELPRSLRQALKIAHSREFQHSCTLLSAALTRGFLRGLTSPRPISPPHPFPSVDKPEIKEICLISCTDPTGAKRETKQDFERNKSRAKVIGSSIYADKSRGQIENKPSKEVLERIFSKLFSEPGLHFTSTVVGNAAYNVVKALFDEFAGHAGASKESSNLVDMLCTQQCKVLINECMETFVNTIVSVYIDKTKDVNIFDDMVAGITNPSHKDPMKDLLTGICNGAVETLVKSSHNVMSGNKEEQQESGFTDQALHSHAIEGISGGFEIQSQNSSYTKTKHFQRKIMSSDADFDPSSSEGEGSHVTLKPFTEGIMQEQEMQEAAWYGMSRKPQQDRSGVHFFIDGLSKTLAIPSNHRLVLDVAGTMTSEAVRSFVDVIVSTISKNIYGKMQKGWGRVKAGAVPIEAQVACKDAANKALLLASICLALCLHILTCIRVEVV